MAIISLIDMKIVNSTSLAPLIVFEGVDGVGKTTIAKLVVQQLTSEGKDIVYESFPGKASGTLGRFVYDLHHSNLHSSIDPTSMQLLHIAAHIDAIENRIKPLLQNGIAVVLDRYWWSTLAYGVVFGANRQSLDAMIDVELKHWDGIQPDFLFYINREMTFESASDLEQSRNLEIEYNLLIKATLKQFEIEIVNNKTIQDTVEKAFDKVNSILDQKIRGAQNVYKNNKGI